MISDEEWEKVEKKYKNLIYMIAHRIGGDKITNDFDDSVQEVSFSAMDAIRTYKKKTDESFEDFFGCTMNKGSVMPGSVSIAPFSRRQPSRSISAV